MERKGRKRTHTTHLRGEKKANIKGRKGSNDAIYQMLIVCFDGMKEKRKDRDRKREREIKNAYFENLFLEFFFFFFLKQKYLILHK